MGRFTDEDARVRSVRAMEQRCHVDTLQADRVEATVVALLEQVESDWGLEDPLAELVLRWAAGCTNGLDIAHSKYHRHSAYLLQHADMPDSRARAATVVRSGGRPPPAIVAGAARGPPAPWDRHAEFLTVLLRVAVLLHRGAVRRRCGGVTAREGTQSDLGAAAPVDEGTSPDARRPGTRARLPEGGRIPVDCGVTGAARLASAPFPANAAHGGKSDRLLASMITTRSS